MQGPRDAFVLLGFLGFTAAAMTGFGEYQPVSLVLVLIGIGATLRATDADPRSPMSRRCWRWGAVCGAAFAVCDLGHLPGASSALVAVVVGAAFVAVTARSRLRRVARVVALVGVVDLLLNSWTWGRAPIDVFAFLQTATHRLVSGANPYGVAIPQTPYTGYAGPAAIPFVYGPGAVLLDAPGRLLGDVRIVHAVAAGVLIACLLRLARSRPAHERWSLAALVLLFPLWPPMIVFAWVDLLSMAAFAGWLTLRRRHPWWAAAALGTSLVTKPSALVAVLVMAVWLPRVRRELAGSILVVVVVAAPFVALTGVRAFWQDVAGNLATQPPRLDSLTLDGFLHAASLPLLPGWLAVVIVLAAGLLVLARRPRDLASSLVAGAFVTAVTLLVAKVAYLNYWFIPAVLLLLALAVGRDGSEPVALPRRRAPQWTR